jgi:hypothetical protein
MITKFAERVLKDAELFRSFVIEETALADLLSRSWLPTLKKIKKQLAPVIDFTTGNILTGKALAFELWITPEMFAEELEKRWEKISPSVEKYLRKSYRRAFSEHGKAPNEAEFSMDRSFESDEPSYAGEDASVLPLLNMVREGFLTYLETDALPAIRQAVTALRQLKRIEEAVQREHEQAAAVAREAVAKYDKEVLNYELCRVAKFTMDFSAWRMDQVDSARASVKDTLSDILAGNTPKSALLANLAVARAHSFGFLDWAWRSGVDYYKISSVLDQRVCAACLAMNGKIFSVRDGMKFRERFLSVVGDKDRMKQAVPFLTKGAADQVTGVTRSAYLASGVNQQTVPFQYDAANEFIQEGKITPRFSSGEEAIEFFEKNHPFSLFTSSGDSEINNRVISMLENFNTMFPGVLDQAVSQIRFVHYGEDSQELARYDESRITVNLDKFKSGYEEREKMNQMSSYFAKTGVYTIESTIAHELGHALYANITKGKDSSGESTVFLSNYGDSSYASVVDKFISDLFIKSVTEKYSKLEDDPQYFPFKLYISKYSLDGQNEMMAEYFSRKMLNRTDPSKSQTEQALDDFFDFINTRKTYSLAEVSKKITPEHVRFLADLQKKRKDIFSRFE